MDWLGKYQSAFSVCPQSQGSTSVDVPRVTELPCGMVGGGSNSRAAADSALKISVPMTFTGDSAGRAGADAAALRVTEALARPGVSTAGAAAATGGATTCVSAAALGPASVRGAAAGSGDSPEFADDAAAGEAWADGLVPAGAVFSTRRCRCGVS